MYSLYNIWFYPLFLVYPPEFYYIICPCMYIYHVWNLHTRFLQVFTRVWLLHSFRRPKHHHACSRRPLISGETARHHPVRPIGLTTTAQQPTAFQRSHRLPLYNMHKTFFQNQWTLDKNTYNNMKTDHRNLYIRKYNE